MQDSFRRKKGKGRRGRGEGRGISESYGGSNLSCDDHKTFKTDVNEHHFGMRAR